jgi:hypothetical protein
MRFNMALIKDRFIPREEISHLLWGMDNEISTHSLSMWLKSKTDDEFIVVPRQFVDMTLSFLEERANTFSKHLPHYKEMMEEFRIIRNYL